MAKSSTELSQEFNEAATSFAELVRGLNDEQWQATAEGEGWSVGTTARHVAQGLQFTWGITDAILSSNMPSFTGEDVDNINAQHAEEHPNPDKAETVAMMEQAIPEITSKIAALDNEALDQTGVVEAIGEEPISVRAWLEMLVIGHIGMHRPSIEAATSN